MTNREKEICDQISKSNLQLLELLVENIESAELRRAIIDLADDIAQDSKSLGFLQGIR